MTFLRNVLIADALATGVAALAMAALAGPLSGWLHLPAPLLFWAGVALAPWVAFVFALARRTQPPARDVRFVIGGNAFWALGCVALALFGGASALGVVFLLAQALVVGAFAELQLVGLRRGVVRSAA